VSLTDALLAHAAAVAGLPADQLRAAAGDDTFHGALGTARDHLQLAEVIAVDDPDTAALFVDDAIQALVSARHNLAPGMPVRRVLPDLRDGLVLMDGGHRWMDSEWRPDPRDPDAYVDQNGVRCSRWALPDSLVVVAATDAD
jgi:hypothetical protein